ncbi:hypothetical protein GpartN1_g2404.t1 [Galdieria partita]|uniref:Transcription factor 25 n=1 Tax=Galdieria partita TaxID=83374 RepID=A0A9C7UP86_9RHOD|nr:hypothetical protein GpartN1_g2404.t1 [Galdieria partita]
MSTRQLRRLERELKAVSLKPEQETEQQSKSDEEPEFFQSVKSPFLLLQSSVGDTLTEDAEKEEFEEQRVHSQTQGSSKNSASNFDEKKKKKKRRSRFRRRNSFSEDGDEVRGQKELSQVGIKEQVIGMGLSKVFWVDPSRLHSKREIRKLFGSNIEGLQDSNDRKQVRGRRTDTRVRSRLGSNFVAKHKSLLVSPEVDWLGTPKDIRLTFVEEDISGYKWFRYDFDGIFVSSRNEFENVVELGDPSLLVDFVNRYPYHVEALVRLSESYALMGEPERSVNLLERVIYILEGAWPPNFKPFRGSCRLKLEEGSNYLLFVVLFRYSHALVRRGLYETSLQVIKLLYNFDWEYDPMGALLYMDTVSILAHDYMFVINSFESASHVKLESLPNYRMNYALAKFCLGHDDANKELLDAILTFPETVLTMLETWKLDIDETYLYILESFSRRHDELASSVANMLHKISKVFVSIAESAWNSVPVRNWLLECVMTACSWIDQGSQRVDKRNDFGLLDTHLFSHVSVADFAHDSSSLPANLIQQQNPIGVAEEEEAAFVENHEGNYASLWRILVDNLFGNDSTNVRYADDNNGLSESEDNNHDDQ